MSDGQISEGESEKLIDGWPTMFAGAASDAPSEPAADLPKAPDGSHGIRQRAPIALRMPLPLSTGASRVKPGQTAEITARPQCLAFRPERLFVSSYSPEYKIPWWKRPLVPWIVIPKTHGAGDWLINDIIIGNRSQFAQAGNLPGDLFSNTAIDSFVTFDTCQTAMDVRLLVTYVGPVKEGCAFTGAMLGTAAR